MRTRRASRAASVPPGPARPRTPRRILVLGSPGSGKTTLTRRLAERAGLPAYHLDDEYWGENWTRPAAGDWDRRLREIIATDAWIVDGNYLPSIRMRAVRAELVVLVEAPALRCLCRVAARAWQIRRGRHLALPARVRAQAEAGLRVAATRDLIPLAGKIVRFRLGDWWTVVAGARSNASAPLIIAVGPGFAPGHAPALRRRLRRRGVTAQVVPPGAVTDYLDWLARTFSKG